MALLLGQFFCTGHVGVFVIGKSLAELFLVQERAAELCEVDVVPVINAETDRGVGARAADIDIRPVSRCLKVVVLQD